MRNEKRWLKQVIKEAADKQFEMPWEQDNRPVAFSNTDKSYEYAEAA
jgi:hypothetical protein